MEIHDRILQKIANTLFGNVQQMNLLGLFDGQLGAALFFYHYSRYINKSIYAEIAGDCFDTVYGNMSINISKDFAAGLTGIGWAVNHLVENKFVEADDDVLEEVDEVVKQMDILDFMNEINDEVPLCSKGLYSITRHDNAFIATTLLQCKELLEKEDLSFSLCYLNSVLYVVIRAYKFGIEISLCKQLIDTLYQHVTLVLAKKHYSESDIFTLRHCISHSAQDISAANNWQLLLNRIEISSKALLTSCWNGLIYNVSGLKYVNMSDIQTFVDDIVSNLRYKDLGLYQGLSGLGIELIKLIQSK